MRDRMRTRASAPCLDAPRQAVFRGVDRAHGASAAVTATGDLTAMDLKQIVTLALQLSVVATVFGFGLKATFDDLLYVVRRPRLLGRAFLALFIVMPFVAVLLTKAFAFPREAEIVLVALAISPVPPLLPRKEVKAGGHSSFGLGLMAMLALASLVVVP